MSREEDFAARMQADSPLTSILTGGIYTAGAVGIQGISRDVTPAAFDADGYLRPASLVRQRASTPDGSVRDGMVPLVSTAQAIEIYLYEDAGYSSIDAAIERLYALFEGYAFADSFPVELTNLIDRQRDEGALAGASLARMDFAVYAVRQ